MIRKLTFYLFVLSLIAAIVAMLWLEYTKPDLSTLPKLQTGDLVFQTHRSSQTLGIMGGTSSLYTHVGIIEKSRDGSYKVIEAVGPVLKTPFEQWIKHGFGGRITIKRYPTLTLQQKLGIIREAESYLGRPYDIYFLFDKESIYCSELAYYAFDEGANIGLGRIQKKSELNLDNFAARQLIAQRWRSYPPCAFVGSIGACMKKIYQQRIITPISVAEDKRLKLIYTNYPFTK